MCLCESRVNHRNFVEYSLLTANHELSCQQSRRSENLRECVDTGAYTGSRSGAGVYEFRYVRHRGVCIRSAPDPHSELRKPIPTVEPTSPQTRTKKARRQNAGPAQRQTYSRTESINRKTKKKEETEKPHDDVTQEKQIPLGRRISCPWRHGNRGPSGGIPCHLEMPRVDGFRTGNASQREEMSVSDCLPLTVSQPSGTEHAKTAVRPRGRPAVR